MILINVYVPFTFPFTINLKLSAMAICFTWKILDYTPVDTTKEEEVSNNPTIIILKTQRYRQGKVNLSCFSDSFKCFFSVAKVSLRSLNSTDMH